MTAGVGYEAFDTRFLFRPESLIYNAAGNLVAPLVNRAAIKAEYLSANARQLEAIYDYQRIVLNAFTEVINRVSKVQNYGRSIEIKKQQLASLESSVDIATKLFQAAHPGIEYVDVLLAQRDLREARMGLIDTKQEQLTAVIDAFQALGGGGAPINEVPGGAGRCRPPRRFRWARCNPAQEARRCRHRRRRMAREWNVCPHRRSRTTSSKNRVVG